MKVCSHRSMTEGVTVVNRLSRLLVDMAVTSGRQMLASRPGVRMEVIYGGSKQDYDYGQDSGGT